MRMLLSTGIAGSFLLSVRAFGGAVSSSVGDVATATAGPEAKGIIDVVLQHGITGAMLLIVLWGYFRKDRQLAEEIIRKDKQLEADSTRKDKMIADEVAARNADSKAFGEAMRTMVERTTTQMERFNDTAEGLVNELRNERRASQSDIHLPPRRGGV